MGHVRGRCSAERADAHSPVILTADCAAHASLRVLIAVPWIARVTVAKGAAGRVPGPVMLELPGTRAEFWIAGAYHQVRARRQSPWCTLWDV